MEVILKEDIANVGRMGEVVRVRDGYARNYLLPRGLVLLANKKNLKGFEHQKRVVASQKERVVKQARVLSERLAAASLTIAVKTGRSEIAKNQAIIEELKRRNIEARETDRGVAVNLPSVNFQFDSAELTPEGRDRVNQVATILKDQASGRRVSVEGHASRERPEQEAYNQKLSERRAQTVAESLQRNGIGPSRIATRGLGTQSPVASNDTEEGRRRNRRVEVIIEN